MNADERHRAVLALVETRGSITVRELAEELGVAAVTARVDVRELARRGLLQRVHGGATRVDGQTPSPAAERPPRTTNHTLGMVVPHASYYYPKVVSGAGGTADELGARIVLGVSQNDVAEERVQVARLLESGVDGLVIATRLDPQKSRETEAWLRSIPVPVVLAERRAGRQSGAVEHVATDHEQGAYDAVQHLAGLGHRQIGLLHFDTITAPRLITGYAEALAALGLPPSAARELRDETPLELEQTAESVRRDVRAGTLDALIVHHDLAALPLVSRLRQLGLDIPGDLAIVAYDDELAALADPPLTAVAPPRTEVGAAAVSLLVERLDDPGRPLHHLLLRPELRIRSSCGAATKPR